MRLPLTLCALLAIGGCSAFGDDLEPISDVLLVSAGPSVESAPVLSLRTETDWGCGGRIVVDEEASQGRLALDIRGGDPLEFDEVNCVTTSPLYVAVVLPEGSPVEITVRHRSETDLYRYTLDANGGTLEAVRMSTTRLGSR